MKYTVTVFTTSGMHPSEPMPRSEMEALTKQIKGARYSAATFPESLITFQSVGGGITFMFPSSILGWEVEQAQDAPHTSQTVADYSVLGDA